MAGNLDIAKDDEESGLACLWLRPIVLFQSKLEQMRLWMAGERMNLKGEGVQELC